MSRSTQEPAPLRGAVDGPEASPAGRQCRPRRARPERFQAKDGSFTGRGRHWAVGSRDRRESLGPQGRDYDCDYRHDADASCQDNAGIYDRGKGSPLRMALSLSFPMPEALGGHDGAEANQGKPEQPPAPSRRGASWGAAGWRRTRWRSAPGQSVLVPGQEGAFVGIGEADIRFSIQALRPLDQSCTSSIRSCGLIGSRPLAVTLRLRADRRVGVVRLEWSRSPGSLSVSAPLGSGDMFRLRRRRAW